MRFPALNRQQTFTKTVNGINGGLNIQDAPEFIDESQLADCENVYFSRGAVQSRPYIREIYGSETPYYTDYIASHHMSDGKWFLTKAGSRMNVINVDTGTIYAKDFGTDDDPDKNLYGGFFTEDTIGHAVYFSHNHNPDVPGSADNNLLYIDVDDTPTFTPNSDYYVPVRFINGIPNDNKNDGACAMDAYEGFNMLTSEYTVRWSPNGTGMYYTLPAAPENGSSLSAFYQGTNGDRASWSLTVDKSATVYSSSYQPISISGTEVNVKLAFDGLTNEMFFVDALNTSAVITLPQSYSGALESTSSRGTDDNNVIFGMKFATWFGGDGNGINGGTRLFVSGNRDIPNVVYWSDVNNLTYFPENNYFYVGDASQKVTAFGKQSDYLIIFKEREVYGCRYSYAAYSSEQIDAGSAVDVTTDAYFPLTQIHAKIGCDIPKTVQLCGNRLVWASTDGNVYTFKSLSNMTEKSVNTISWAIAPDIFAKLKVSNAAAAIWDNHYVLCVGEEMYLFDFTSNGFTYYSSYYDEKRAGSRIPWFKWRLPKAYYYNGDEKVDFGLSVFSAAGNGEHLLMLTVCTYQGLPLVKVFEIKENETMDMFVDNTKVIPVECESDIQSFFSTKAFNFDRPINRKMVTGFSLLSKDVPGVLSVSYETDMTSGEDRESKPLRREIGQNAFSATRFPCREERVRTISAKIYGTGKIAVSGFVWEFRPIGEVQ